LSLRRPLWGKCSVISGARKERPIASNHKACIPPKPWRGVLLSYEILFSRPRPALRNIGLEVRDRGSPAGACGAIGLPFRALAKSVSKIRSTNWEMIQRKKYSVGRDPRSRRPSCRGAVPAPVLGFEFKRSPHPVFSPLSAGEGKGEGDFSRKEKKWQPIGSSYSQGTE
jgi:hypothetical protein